MTSQISDELEKILVSDGEVRHKVLQVAHLKELMLDDNGHLVRQCLLLHWHVGSYFLPVTRVVR